MAHSVAVELQRITGTVGWQYAMKIAEEIVREAADTALDGKTDVGVARGHRDFLRTFQARIESAAQEYAAGEISTISMGS